jgi:excisionase family DNA binding protein
MGGKILPTAQDLTRRDTENELRIGATKFYQLIQDGDLEAYRLGGPRSPLRVTRASVDRFKAKYRVKPGTRVSAAGIGEGA